MSQTDEQRLNALEFLRADLPAFAEECLRIRPKDAMNTPILPLVFNRTQLFLHKALEEQRQRTGKVRAILGKGRQTTVSTYIGARFYHKTTFWRGIHTYILTHEQPASDNLFEMVERFQEFNPLRPSTGINNAKELTFDRLGSSYEVGTAGTKAGGRSQTIQLLHWCVAEGTLIVTPEGRLKPVERFEIGDEVRTHRNAVAPISFISKQTKLCQEVVFRSLTSFPLRLSGEHRIWTRAGWQMIDDVPIGDSIGFPVRKISHEIVCLPYRVAPLRSSGNKPNGPDQIHLTYELGRVIGLYLAEGTVIKQPTSAIPSAVTFSVHEREASRTVEWLGPLENAFRSVKVTPNPDSKTVHVTVYGKSFATFMWAMAGVLDAKRIPDKWWMMGEDFVRGMVHGYLSGDGHFSPANSRIIEATSVREAITIGMRDALASLGYGWASIKFKPAGVRFGRNERAAYTMRLCGSGVERLSEECGKPTIPRRDLGNFGNVVVEDGYAWLPIVSKTPIGKQTVYDFEVGHDDHSYCTIHGATHNSEVAFSPNANGHFAGIVQTVPDLPGTEIILESTGNGPTGAYYQHWQDAEAGTGDYMALFVPWFWTAEYSRPVVERFDLDEEEQSYRQSHGLSLGQMAWRRAKIVELKDPKLFKQEYPACIAAGQRVGVEQVGLIAIERIRPGYDTATGAIGAVMANGTRQTVKVTTELGYEVICTPDHRLSVWPNSWVEAAQTQGQMLALSPPAFSKHECVVEWQPFPCVTSKLHVTERFGRLLGYFMGDGSWHDGTFSIVCTGVDDDVVADVIRLVTEFIGPPTTRSVGKQGGGTEVRVGCSNFAAVLRVLGIIRPTAPHRIVKIPESIFASPEPVVREFLRGLFEADGFCQKSGAGMSLFSKHEGFLRDVQLLLLGFGITSRRTRERKIAKDGRVFPGNALILRATETRQFLRHIGFMSRRKQDRLTGYEASDLGRPSPERPLVDRVFSITPAGVREVYDLSIPGAECFDAGGILVHNCAIEMFEATGEQSYIDPETVLAARKATKEGFGPLVIGVDPSRFGDDRFSIAWRKGRKVIKVESRAKIGTTEALTWLRDIIDQDKPARMFIDAGGGGDRLYDILQSWGEPYEKVIKLVNFGGKPLTAAQILRDGTKRPGPVDRRAEMWMRSRDWLEQPAGADIPDRDSLQADACAPRYTYQTTDQKLRLESKEQMRARGVRSPDEWDAIALTFAEPVRESLRQAIPDQVREAPNGPGTGWLGV